MADLAIINLCWLMATLAGFVVMVVTASYLGDAFFVIGVIVFGFLAGIATTAAMSICMKMAKKEEGYIFRGFWKAFKANVKNGGILGMLLAVLIYFYYVNFQIHHTKGLPFPMLIAIVITMVFGYLYFLYSFGLTARYENTIRQTLKNSLLFSIRFFPNTILMTVQMLIVLIAFAYVAKLSVLFYLLGPGIMLYTMAVRCVVVFDKYEALMAEDEEWRRTHPEE